MTTYSDVTARTMTYARQMLRERHNPENTRIMGEVLGLGKELTESLCKTDELIYNLSDEDFDKFLLQTSLDGELD